MAAIKPITCRPFDVRRSSLYVVLARLEDQGLIEGREGEVISPRRLYRITDAGRALLPTAKVR